MLKIARQKNVILRPCVDLYINIPAPVWRGSKLSDPFKGTRWMFSKYSPVVTTQFPHVPAIAQYILKRVVLGFLAGWSNNALQIFGTFRNTNNELHHGRDLLAIL